MSSEVGELSSLIVVVTLAAAGFTATASKPPLLGLLIVTAKSSAPSAYASSTVATVNGTLVLPAGIVTCVVAATMSPVSALR